MKSFVLIVVGGLIGAAAVLAVELPARERERAATEAKWQAGYDRLADHADAKLREVFSKWEDDSGKWASLVDRAAAGSGQPCGDWQYHRPVITSIPQRMPGPCPCSPACECPGGPNCKCCVK